MVDPEDGTYAADKASQFIKYDFINHKNNHLHATNIINILNEKKIAVNGCVTFWEDCGPLAATICDLLGLHGPGQQAADIAKMKSHTHDVLRTRTGDIPHFPRTYLYSGKCYKIESEADIDLAIDHVGVPSVLKLEYGTSAIGVKPIRDRIYCTEQYRQIKSSLRTEKDHPGIGPFTDGIYSWN